MWPWRGQATPQPLLPAAAAPSQHSRGCLELFWGEALSPPVPLHLGCHQLGPRSRRLRGASSPGSSITALALSFPPLLTLEGVMNLSRDQCYLVCSYVGFILTCGKRCTRRTPLKLLICSASTRQRSPRRGAPSSSHADPAAPACRGPNVKNAAGSAAGGTPLRAGRRNTVGVFKSNLKNLFVASVCLLVAGNT